MKLFTCSNCGNSVHFDNRTCVNCGSRLGFDSGTLSMRALAPAGGDQWSVIGNTDTAVRFCANAMNDICNWLVPAGSQNTYCVACSYNHIVPVTDNPEGVQRWQKIGQAQRHLFYSILRWNLPRPGRDADPQGGLVFDFLADEVDANGNIIQAAMTGHEDGLISLRAAEADDATRESIRVSMGEPYRTLLGHFRHEIGHFYFAQLCRDEETLAEARALFGDEREDYAAALQRNYEQGPPIDWQNRFISTYASCHPSEDFAECWAHFFHIVDTLETARAFGLSTDPRRHEEMAAEVDFDPYNVRDAQTLVDAWVPLSVALNSIQRSMGQTDSYPFVLSIPVVQKLEFLNRLIHKAGQGNLAMAAPPVQAPEAA